MFFRYLNRANAFIFSSLWEWFWLVLVEALSLWLPIISTDCLAWPREILAQELSLDKKIKYPYIWKYWILTKVFENENNIKDYSKVMNDLVINNFKIEEWWLIRFDIINIIKEWEELIS